MDRAGEKSALGQDKPSTGAGSIGGTVQTWGVGRRTLVKKTPNRHRGDSGYEEPNSSVPLTKGFVNKDQGKEKTPLILIWGKGGVFFFFGVGGVRCSGGGREVFCQLKKGG